MNFFQQPQHPQYSVQGSESWWEARYDQLENFSINFGEPYSLSGGGGWNYIGSKWSLIIIDHFGTNVVPTTTPPPVKTTLHTHTYRLTVITPSVWSRPFGTTRLKSLLGLIRPCFFHSHPRKVQCKVRNKTGAQIAADIVWLKIHVRNETDDRPLDWIPVGSGCLRHPHRRK